MEAHAETELSSISVESYGARFSAPTETQTIDGRKRLKTFVTCNIISIRTFERWPHLVLKSLFAAALHLTHTTLVNFLARQVML